MTSTREAGGGATPGRTSDVLRDELTPYNEEQRDAFVAAYKSTLESYPGDLERALKIAHAAARGTPGER